MIVHLAASLRNPEADTEYLRAIIEVIHDKGGALTFNWLETALARHKDIASSMDSKRYVETNLEAIKRSDVVVVELTYYSFSQGFLIAAALQHKKPVLVVSRTSFSGEMVTGIVDSLFQYKEYSTKEELEQLVNTFINKNTIHTKDLRFNMFLTRQIFKYLEDTSRETGKNKSEIIRELIKRKAQER